MGRCLRELKRERTQRSRRFLKRITTAEAGPRVALRASNGGLSDGYLFELSMPVSRQRRRRELLIGQTLAGTVPPPLLRIVVGHF
jgi:hypothetical protein